MAKVFSKWYIYLVAVIAIVTAFCISVTSYTAPERDEKINFFIGAHNVHINQLNEDLEANVPEYLKVINARFHSIDNSDFSHIFASTRSILDFYIIPESYFKENKEIILNYSANIKTDYLNNYFNDTLTYCYDDESHAKGFRIYNAITKKGLLLDYVTYELDVKDYVPTDYYLFFYYDSINIGQLNGISKTTNAFEVIKDLYESL